MGYQIPRKESCDKVLDKKVKVFLEKSGDDIKKKIVAAYEKGLDEVTIGIMVVEANESQERFLEKVAGKIRSDFHDIDNNWKDIINTSICSSGIRFKFN